MKSSTPSKLLQPSRDDLIGYAVQSAKKAGVPASWFLALLDSESGIAQYSSPGVVKTSSAGARGVGQLMPGTARGLGVNPDDPYQNIEGAARYFSGQLQRFGTPELALSAYNSGPAGSEASGQIEQFPETIAYVEKVRQLERQYAQMLGSSAPESVVPSGPPSPGGYAAPPSTGGPVAGQSPTFTPSGGVRQASLDAFSRTGPLSGRASDAIAKSQMGRAKFAEDMNRVRGLFQPTGEASAGISAVNGQAAPVSTTYTPSGLALPLSTPTPQNSEFETADAEGAPDALGNRHHAAVDWFAPAGSPLSSPVDGEVVEVKASRGNSGQVFGGVVKVRGADGVVHVFRHVDPSGVSVGQTVRAGMPIAKISAWESGSPHTHVEIWRTLDGGYNFENMIDPTTVYGGS